MGIAARESSTGYEGLFYGGLRDLRTCLCDEMETRNRKGWISTMRDRGNIMKKYCPFCKRRTRHRLGNTGEWICEGCGRWSEPTAGIGGAG